MITQLFDGVGNDGIDLACIPVIQKIHRIQYDPQISVSDALAHLDYPIRIVDNVVSHRLDCNGHAASLRLDHNRFQTT